MSKRYKTHSSGVLRGLMLMACVLALSLSGCGADEDASADTNIASANNAASDADFGSDLGTNNPDAGASSSFDMSRPESSADAGEELENEADMGPDASTAVTPRMVVSNEGDFGQLAETGLVIGPPNGTFNTDTDCTSNSGLGMCAPVVLAGDRPDACVCRADEVVISDLRVEGSRALVVLAWTSITVRERLDVGGERDLSGPGSIYVYAEDSNFGGSGGSFGTRGAGASLDVFGNPELVPLIGGSDGQSTCGTEGGGGGGAVQLSAGERVTILGTINAGGGGGARGAAGDDCSGGAGGGSGGAILIEAPSVDMSGTLAANGGGGGGGGTSSYNGYVGKDASSLERAVGGEVQRERTCAIRDDVYSGHGGSGATADEAARTGGDSEFESGCVGATVYGGEGGDGGGLGRIRVNSNEGQNCVCAGNFSPSPTLGSISFR